MTAGLTNFPRIPHFPGSCGTEDDLWLGDAEMAALWRQPLVVLEKRDGINVAIGKGPDGRLQVALRGGFDDFADGALRQQVWFYVMQRAAAFDEVLAARETLYGEWLRPRLQIAYRRLPDWLVLFARATRTGQFAPFRQVHDDVRRVGLTVTQPLYVGRVQGLDDLRRWLGPSPFGATTMEGLIVEPLRPGVGPRFAKWVAPGFRRRLPDRQLRRCNRLRVDAPARMASSLIVQP